MNYGLEAYSASLAYQEPINSVRPRRDHETLVEEPKEYHSDAAYALQHNMLGLRGPWQEHRLLLLTLSFRVDQEPGQASKAADDFMTNYVRRGGEVETWLRVVGRTRKGRIHYHYVVVTKEFCGDTNPVGTARRKALKEKWAAGWSAHGRMFLAEVKNLDGLAVYLAFHVEGAQRERNQSKKYAKLVPDVGIAVRISERVDRLEAERNSPRWRREWGSRWKGIRLCSYAANFNRTVSRQHLRVSNYTNSWRRAVGVVAARLGHDAGDSMGWVLFHRREIKEVQDQLLCQPEKPKPMEPIIWLVDPHSTLGVRGPQTLYPQVVLARGAFPWEPRTFWCSRAAVGEERHYVFDREGREGVHYDGICRVLSDEVFRLLLQVQPRFGELGWWLKPRSAVHVVRRSPPVSRIRRKDVGVDSKGESRSS